MATNREKAIEHRDAARRLNNAWRVGARDYRFRETGDWYLPLVLFPAAYFDRNGYVLFRTKEDYHSIKRKYAHGRKQVSLPGGIATLPGYVRVRDEVNPVTNGLWAERRLEILRSIDGSGGHASRKELLKLLSDAPVFKRKGPREEVAQPPEHYFNHSLRWLQGRKYVESVAGRLDLTNDGRELLLGTATPAEKVSRPSAEVAQDVRDVYARSDISATQKESLVNARIGQGEFRRRVLHGWDCRCAVTGSQTLDVVRASHIKPWRESDDEERLDPENGLPLVATLDALFDSGLVTFAPSGKMIVSPVLSGAERRVLGLRQERLARKLTGKAADYLAWHKKNRFQK